MPGQFRPSFMLGRLLGRCPAARHPPASFLKLGIAIVVGSLATLATLRTTPCDRLRMAPSVKGSLRQNPHPFSGALPLALRLAVLPWTAPCCGHPCVIVPTLACSQCRGPLGLPLNPCLMRDAELPLRARATAPAPTASAKD